MACYNNPMGKAPTKKKLSVNEVLCNSDRQENELRPSEESQLKGNLLGTTSIISFFPIFIIILLCCVSYYNALFNDFVSDDYHQILNNPLIRDIRNIPAIFSTNVWAFQQGHLSNYYRPMMHVIYLLNYQIIGLKPFGYHLVNIVFHCGVSVILFLFIRRLLADHQGAASSLSLSPPFIAALLFSSHPIHTEAVSWIASLPEVAFTFFYLLSLYQYILFREGDNKSYLFSILSFLAASLFKETALTLPIMLVAYDHLFRKSDKRILRSIETYIPYLAVAGVYLLARYYVLGSLSPMDFYGDMSTYELIINVFPLFRDYLSSLLWPFNLNFWHTFYPIRSIFEAKGLISAAVTLIYLIVAAAAYRKNKVFFFSLLLVVIPLLPVLFIQKISGKPFAERYLYLPSAGYVVILAVFLSWVKKKLPDAVTSISVVFIVIVGIYTVGTVSRNNVWKNAISLWSDTVRKSPDSAQAHYDLGIAYASGGRIDEAIKEYESALDIDPFQSANLYLALGLAYDQQNRSDEALEMYKIALSVEPNSRIHKALGDAYAKRGLTDYARYHYEEASKLSEAYWARR